MSTQVEGLETAQQRSVINTDLRTLLIGLNLVALLSADAILVLVYGLLGMKGNTASTGAFFVISELAIIIFSFSHWGKIKPSDYFFILFLICIAISTSLSAPVAPVRDWALLLLSLSAYVCGRFIKANQLAYIRLIFVRLAFPIATIGTMATAYALVNQWNDPHGKPIVFGFDAWATHFLVVLGLYTLAIASTKLDLRKTVATSAFTLLPIAIFSASSVRFTFVALLGGLFVAALFSDNKQRIYVAIIAAVIVVGITAGLFARLSVTSRLLSYAVENTKEKTVEDIRENKKANEAAVPLSSPKFVVPSCGLDINEFNSIAVRKALLRDAIYLSSKAGFFGLGFDSFKVYSCVPNMEVHITFFQTLVEFGWLAAIGFLGLLALAILPLIRQARIDETSRWLLCWVAYEVTIGLGYGSINHEIPLFLMTGIAVAVGSAAKGRPKLTMLRGPSSSGARS